MNRKDVSRGIRKFSQNVDHFAWTNTYTQMRGRDFSREGKIPATVQGGGEFSGQGQRLVWGRRVGGSWGQSPPDAGKIFIENPMKNYNFRAIFQNFNENFAIFPKFLKNFSNFSRKSGEKLELCSCRGFRGQGPRTPEKISNIFIKNQLKITILGQFFKILMNIFLFLQIGAPRSSRFD